MKNLHPTAADLDEQEFVLLWEEQDGLWIYTKNMLTIQTAKAIALPDTYWAYPYWINPNNETDNAHPFVEVTIHSLSNGKLLQHGDLLFHIPNPPLNNKTPVHSV